MDENRDLKETTTDAAQGGLADDKGARRKRVEFPLVQCERAARPDEEITPERAAEILLAQEAEWFGCPPVRGR